MDYETKNLKPFIWKKKLEEEGIDIDESEAEAEARRQQELNRAELRELRERRAKLEQESEQKRKDSEFLARQREAEKYQHWEQQEEDFVLRQRRTRSKIRIRDGRAKPIDLFIYYISVFGDQSIEEKNKLFIKDEEIDLSDSPIELVDPCDWFNGMRLGDLESLITEMKVCLKSDPQANRTYWRDLLTIAEDEFMKLRSAKQAADNKSSDDDCLKSVAMDIASLFEGKSLRELDKLSRDIEDKLSENDPSIDHHFWETALAKLKAHMARLRLGSMHRENLRNQAQKHLPSSSRSESRYSDSRKHIDSEKHPQKDAESANLNAGTSAPDVEDKTHDDEEAEKKDQSGEEKLKKELEPDEEQVEDDATVCMRDYELGCYSPNLLSLQQLEPSTVVVDYASDYALLEHQRRKVMNATTLDEAKLATMSADERAFLEVASKGMGGDEAAFSCEERVTMTRDNQTSMIYTWADKYKPRKPRYYNRVHTGFEWNKYNQTHYDIDNPPPKVVQGYKFNIFYPDLIDKHKTPTYTLTPCKDDKDFTVIRFSAGPPYEDIAFRIVNREWNNSSKNGFRCQFVNNILQLWFHFKRYRYRR